MRKFFIQILFLVSFLGFSQEDNTLIEAGKSPSLEAMKRTYNKAALNGGVTQDFSANVENIRDISRGISYNCLKDATFVYVPSSYGEGKNFGQFNNTAITGSDFTFTRATTATVTNKLGVIEDSCYNLLQRSDDFDNAAWTKNGTIVVTPNSVVAPNGTLTADLISNTVATVDFISQVFTTTATSIYTYSCYIKNNNAVTSSIVIRNTITDVTVGLKWSGSTLTSLTNITGVSNFIYVGNGWYRIHTTFTNLDLNIRPRLTPDNTTIGNSIYIWGAQLTQGSTLRPYLRTTNRLNVPKLDYSLSLADPSLLIEPQSTNLLLNSATGTTQNITTTATPYTLSIYGTGTYTLSGSYTGSLVGSGSGRSVLTFTPTAGTLTLTASGTITNVQLENRSSVTTYIPTTSSSVTRNGETSFVDLQNNNLLNQTNWTLFYEGYLYSGEGTSMSFCLSDTSTASSNTNQIGWFDSIQPFYNIGGVRTNSGLTYSSNSLHKFAIEYNNGTVDYWVDGVEVSTGNSVPVFDYRYLILNNGGSTFATNKIALFNRTLSDTECENLTN